MTRPHRDREGGIMTEIAEDGGPAFPGDANDWGYRGGMSLRDYFAGQALSAIAILDRVPGEPKHGDYFASVADYAYSVADAMLKARSHPTPSSPSEMEQTA